MHAHSPRLVVMIAGAKGAVGSTVAAAVQMMRRDPALISNCLTTADDFSFLGGLDTLQVCGWDICGDSLPKVLEMHGVMDDANCAHISDALDAVQIKAPPPQTLSFARQVQGVMDDIAGFRAQWPGARPVMVNLLPAAVAPDRQSFASFAELYAGVDPSRHPDLVYASAAIQSGVPVVNFSPNQIELPFLLREAAQRGVPLCGRDGKTGQTYFKMVLASAFKARALKVAGWYSLNILGNADGRNLQDPRRAAGKLANKTDLLDGILGYSVGGEGAGGSHKVHIDYYPPRGDAKEAWDVIDFSGLFGLPMSMRVNLQGRDSILAAPLVIDLARWMAAVQASGRGGPVPALAFFFKMPVGAAPPLTFEDQLTSLSRLKTLCDKVSGDGGTCHEP